MMILVLARAIKYFFTDKAKYKATALDSFYAVRNVIVTKKKCR